MIHHSKDNYVDNSRVLSGMLAIRVHHRGRKVLCVSEVGDVPNVYGVKIVFLVKH